MLDQETIFNILYKRYKSYVFAANRILDNPSLAEDVIQEVSRKLVELRPRLENEKHCVDYLYRAIRNQAINTLRLETKYDERPLSAINAISYSDNNGIFELYEWLTKALNMEEPVVVAFMRHILCKDQINELAKEINMNPNALRQRFHCLKHKLKNYYLNSL